MKKIFITGISTGVGKTVASAICCEALQADYWKPVQAGDLDQSDTLTVQSLISNSKTIIHPEAFRLKIPAAPVVAAQKEGFQIDLNQLPLPSTENTLVVEGAGGLLVPINEQHTFLDFTMLHQLPVIIVARTYLGSMNHTLLTVEMLRAKNILIAGLIFNEENQDTEAYIAKKSGLPVLLRIPFTTSLTPEFVRQQATSLRKELL
ncbi:MAG: dethiobiotin synthase [Chitinophagales bacterium]